MAYLQPAEYPDYGLPTGTTTDLVIAASSLINSYCRRPDLNITQYEEQLRVVAGSNAVRLSYLPLATLGAASTPLVGISCRYANPRRGEGIAEPMFEIVSAFSLPGQWTSIDINTVDVNKYTGEITLPMNLLGLPYNEVKVTYSAGLSVIGDDVKSACAQIVRNAQATPALNASKTKIDTMQIQYFSSSLLDETVKMWLRPYVTSRLG